MRKLMTAGFALSALFAASGNVHSELNYPWCLMGDTRGCECVFSSREQCMQDGRNRGFGGRAYTYLQTRSSDRFRCSSGNGNDA
jgi:Protein of unknown function (DUF3551)